MRLSCIIRSCLFFHHADVWPPQLLEAVRHGCTVTENFINAEEEENLLQQIEPHMKRLRYEKDHWDDAIYLYREREMRDWWPENAAVVRRIQDASFTDELIRSPYVHVLDLHADGHIRPHIDSERYCGEVVSGVSLLSDSVMRLRHDRNKELAVDLHLKRFSLYKLSGPGRHDFTHEILASADSFFQQVRVDRSRRISIICRDVPQRKPEAEPIFETGRFEENRSS